jgi:SAM-dependent methyltransferase
MSRTRSRSDAAVQTAVLEAMALAPRYHRWIVQWFGSALAGHVVEVGAGDGTVTRLLLELPGTRVTAVEPDAGRLAGLRAAFADEPEVRIVAGRAAGLGPGDAAGATVLYVNVLEHVADDVAELRHAAAIAGSRGRVCVFVPALPALYSRLDAELGHHRRYTRASLRAAAEAAGLRVERLAYFDRAGAVAWWLLHTVAGWRINPGSASLYDRLVPLLRPLDAVLPLPFGKNLICECVPADAAVRPLPTPPRRGSAAAALRGVRQRVTGGSA